MPSIQRLVILTSLVTALLPSICTAASRTSTIPNTPQAVEKLEQLFPGFRPKAILRSRIPGYYTVELRDGREAHISRDGKTFFVADIYAVKHGDRVVNITERRRSADRAKLIGELPVNDFIVASPTGVIKTYITVFTDVDCPYCQKFHDQLPALLKQGIEVRFAAFPRAGMSGQTAQKMISVWCSKHRARALSDALQGRDIKTRQCKNPVERELKLGQTLGISGTPTIFFADGGMYEGITPTSNLTRLALSHRSTEGRQTVGGNHENDAPPKT